LVEVNVPEMGPAIVGTKLSISVQLDPAASCPLVTEDEFNCGQVELALSVKLDEMLGLEPVAGTEKLRGLFPMFVMVTVWGLLLLFTPTAEDRKLRAGGFWALNSWIRPLVLL
jgi:hypothetical protein